MREPFDPDDLTKVRNQPALTTSSGRIWLVTGGIFAAVSVIMLFLLRGTEPAGLAEAAIVVDVLLYAGMLLCVAWITRPRLKLGLLATLMLAIAAMSLVAILVIAWTEWGA